MPPTPAAVAELAPLRDAPPGPGPAASRAPRITAERILLAVGLLVGLGVIVARLGPALVGAKYLSGTDELLRWYPWGSGVNITPVVNPWVGDTIDSMTPAFLEMHHRFFHGDLPWTSTLDGAGNDLLASPGTALTPALLPFLLLPTGYALGVAKVVQIVGAGLGMTLWLRRLGVRTPAGVLAALAYAGSGFFVAWGNWQAQTGVAAWAPMVFWGAERLMQVRTVRSALPLTFGTAFLLLSGFPAAAGHIAYAATGYVIVRLVAARRRLDVRGTVRVVLIGAGAVLLGAAMSAIQELPQVRNLSGVDLAYRTDSFHITQPVQSLLSVFFPRAMTEVGYPTSNPIEAYAFLGLGVVLLAVLAVLRPRVTGVGRGTTWYLAGAMLVCAALIWKQGFWTDWMAHLPTFQGNRSGRIRDVFDLFGCALAGIGANLFFRLAADRGWVRRERLRAAAVAGAGTAAAGIALWFADAHAPAGLPRHDLFVADALLGLGTMAAVTAGLLLTRRPAFRVGLFTVVLGLVGVQTALSVQYFWPLTPTSSFYPSSPLTDAVAAQTGSDRLATIGSMPGSGFEGYGVRTLTGHTFQPQGWEQLMLALDANAYTGAGRTPTNPQISLGLTDGSLTNPLLDRLSVNTILAIPGSALPGPVRTTAGTAAPAGPGTGTTTLAVGADVTVGLTPQSVRGLQFQVAQTVAGGATGVVVHARVDDAHGRPVADGALGRTQFDPGVYQMAVAGEQLAAAAGPLTVHLSLTGFPGGPTAMTLVGAGGEALRVVGAAADGLTETFSAQNGSLWHRATALPRIRWAGAAVVRTDSAQRVAELRSGALPGSTVVLAQAADPGGGGRADLAVRADTGDQVQVDVNAATAGYLVVADAVQTGWVVSVDGTTQPLRDADEAFGAVFVAAGRHVVLFSYVGRDLRLGAALSAGGVLAVLATLSFTRRGRHPNTAHRPLRSRRGGRPGLRGRIGRRTPLTGRWPDPPPAPHPPG